MACKSDGCSSAVKVRGWCARHYMAWYKSTGFQRMYKRGSSCGVAGCPRLARSRGHCSTHYRRMMTHGTATPTGICAVCGGEFLRTIRNTVYCSNRCAALGLKAQRRAQTRARTERDRPAVEARREARRLASERMHRERAEARAIRDAQRASCLSCRELTRPRRSGRCVTCDMRVVAVNKWERRVKARGNRYLLPETPICKRCGHEKHRIGVAGSPAPSRFLGGRPRSGDSQIHRTDCTWCGIRRRNPGVPVQAIDAMYEVLLLKRKMASLLDTHRGNESA